MQNISESFDHENTVDTLPPLPERFENVIPVKYREKALAVLERIENDIENQQYQKAKQNWKIFKDTIVDENENEKASDFVWLFRTNNAVSGAITRSKPTKNYFEQPTEHLK